VVTFGSELDQKEEGKLYQNNRHISQKFHMIKLNQIKLKCDYFNGMPIVKLIYIPKYIYWKRRKRLIFAYKQTSESLISFLQNSRYLLTEFFILKIQLKFSV